MAVAAPPWHQPRPFLKWAGGKGQVLDQYHSLFPTTFQTYYEPFLGGGAVFFYLSPVTQKAVLMDINPELVNVYQCVQTQVDALIARLHTHQRQHSKDYYYAVRSQLNLHPVDRAARFLYLNKTCYNGLYRENSKGQFNVPMGRYKNPKICDEAALRAAATALQTAQIYQAPFEAVLQLAQGPRDFVYLDPPYHPISATSSFTAYNRYAFSPEDQIRLQQTFQDLAQRGVNVMLSNSDCDFIRHLYRDFTIHTIQATRNINSNATRRGRITEVLVTSYPTGRSDHCRKTS